MKKLVITYKNADLDSEASAYAYSEYLQKTIILKGDKDVKKTIKNTLKQIGC